MLLTTDKTKKKLPTSDKKLTDNRQRNEILTDNRHVDPPFRPFTLDFCWKSCKFANG